MKALRQWLWVLPLLVLPLFAFFFASGLEIEADNLKYMGIAWGMHESGNYLVPFANGAPYTDKPPLLFWMILVCWHVFGMNAVGLQCLISVLLGAWVFMTKATYAVLFPEDKMGQTLLPYLMVGSFALLGYAHFLHVDLFLVTGVLLANLGVCKRLNASSSRSRVYIVLGVFIGLFAKGPVIYVFTLLPLLVSMLFNHAYRTHFFKIIGLMMMGTALFLMAWVIPVILMTSHEFLQQILYKQIADRATYEDDKTHFFYLLKLPYLLLPWALNILFIRKFSEAVVDVWKRNSFVLAIVIAGVLVLSFFGQKRFWYLLPCIPYCMIVLTRFFVAQRANAIIVCVNQYLFTLLFLVLSVLAVGLWVSPELQRMILKEAGESVALSSVMVGGLFALSGSVTVYFLIVRNKIGLMRLLGVAGMTVALLYVMISPYFFSFIENSFQLVVMKQILREQTRKNDGLVLLSDGGPVYLFNYIAKMRIIPVLSHALEIQPWLDQHPHGIVIVHAKQCPEPLRLLLASHDMHYLLCRQ